MEEQTLDRFTFPKKLKEELVCLVLYKGVDAKIVAEKFGLPNVHIFANWINLYKKKLEAGAITLAPMEKKTKVKTAALRQRIKQLEKSLEKAKVMIYGLNAMIDYTEKELKVPVRKSVAPNSSVDQRKAHYKDGRPGPLCRLFGKSRRAFYNPTWDLSEQEQTEVMVEELIRQLRGELPGLEGHKMYKCIYQLLRTNNLKVGRDKMFTIMGRNDALLTVQKSINAYNNVRPHLTCNFLTPNQAHLTTQPLVKHWKRRKNIKEKRLKGIGLCSKMYDGRYREGSEKDSRIKALRVLFLNNSWFKKTASYILEHNQKL